MDGVSVWDEKELTGDTSKVYIYALGQLIISKGMRKRVCSEEGWWGIESMLISLHEWLEVGKGI